MMNISDYRIIYDNYSIFLNRFLKDSERKFHLD